MSARESTVLERILAQTREEVERRKRERPLSADSFERERAGADSPNRFREALDAEGIGVIAEFKRRSPSAGALREHADLEAIVGAYERGGAAAVSVLTEGPNFGGALDDLRAARRVCSLPLLRKDFVLDDYQLREALAAGADAVLLIVAALAQPQLAHLHTAAHELGLAALVEVHDREELRRALDVGARIVGVNNRDLRDFSVDITRTETLLRDVPAGVSVVSESGISSPQQLRRLDEQGVSAVLVGEALMRAPDPAAAVEALTAPA
ncbi:MAG TPA: indole-3-glycerol phosphate synthase TrpC [Solirubrobacteraceae bacterium]|nr:indole-3-glycerol phosphate synthase TrpC [Solirubrobacteraceae bacterium]